MTIDMNTSLPDLPDGRVLLDDGGPCVTPMTLAHLVQVLAALPEEQLSVCADVLLGSKSAYKAVHDRAAAEKERRQGGGRTRRSSRAGEPPGAGARRVTPNGR